MAVRNEWVGDSAVEAGRRGASSHVSGGKEVTVLGTFEIAAADSDASIFKLAKLPANAIPVYAEILADASIDGTDFDLGLYREDGVVQDKDIFADGLNLAAGVAITAGSNNGLTNLGGADPLAAVGKKVWELLGLTVDSKREAYILALTANTIGGAAGTISYKFTYIISD
jgi:hypothetical protein